MRKTLWIVLGLVGAGPVAADGLHPEEMGACLGAEAAFVLDAVAARPDVQALDPGDVVAAFGQSFVNCGQTASAWLQCFEAADTLGCLTAMGDEAETALTLEQAAATLLAGSDATALAAIASGDKALAAHDAGLGAGALDRCGANPPAGVPQAEHAEACRILSHLQRYAAFAGGMRLHADLASVAFRPVPVLASPRADLLAECMESGAAALAAWRDGGSGDAPVEEIAAFFDCVDIGAVATRCAGAGPDCLETEWRTSRAVSIAAELAYTAGAANDPAAGDGVTPDLVRALADALMRQCVPDDLSRGPEGEVYFMLCRIMSNRGLTATYWALGDLDGGGE